MNKVLSLRRVLFVFCSVLFFTVLIPLPGVNKVYAGVTTNDEKSDIKLNVKKKVLVIDSSYTLVLYNTSNSHKISFKSSDSDIASVNSKGVVSAKDIGDATITVTVKHGFKTVTTLTCDITVGPAAVDIKIKGKEIKLTVGNSTTLDTILTPNNTVEEIKFSSSDPSVATVSSSGRITAKSAGTTYIFGSIRNGKFDKILVTVTEER